MFQASMKVVSDAVSAIVSGLCCNTIEHCCDTRLPLWFPEGEYTPTECFVREPRLATKCKAHNPSAGNVIVADLESVYSFWVGRVMEVVQPVSPIQTVTVNSWARAGTPNHASYSLALTTRFTMSSIFSIFPLRVILWLHWKVSFHSSSCIGNTCMQPFSSTTSRSSQVPEA